MLHFYSRWDEDEEKLLKNWRKKHELDQKKVFIFYEKIREIKWRAYLRDIPFPFMKFNSVMISDKKSHIIQSMHESVQIVHSTILSDSSAMSSLHDCKFCFILKKYIF